MTLRYTMSNNIRCDFVNGKVYRMFKHREKETGLSVNSRGYHCFWLDGKMVKVHKYLYQRYHNVTLQPNEEIDHINRIKTDNRIVNLRVVTRAQNCQNRESYKNSTRRYKGVSWNRQRNKWQAEIYYNHKKEHLGLFINEEQACDAYITRAKYLNEHHGCCYHY